MSATIVLTSLRQTLYFHLDWIERDDFKDFQLKFLSWRLSILKFN
ncbi:hypothetical protein NIES2104_15510 [Leptolyngbya sp. NIES-2104]|nr:hypothetical protein NIES2104_15510 [Leptolyngbya sp. NIES-2104]